MRTIKFMMQKEFIQLFRNKFMLIGILMGPVIQLLILPLAANYEIKNISVAFIDHDNSTYSRNLSSKILSSGYFELAGYESSYNNGLKLIEKDKADIVLEIPSGFERNLTRESKQQLFLAINAINGVKASLGGAYLSQIISDFNSEIRLQWSPPVRFNQAPSIGIAISNWFNPLMSYFILMVPGFIVTLLTGVGGFMAALNIVKEKEIGTLEQLNVSPIKKSHFIIGKLLPFWILGFFIFTIGLIIARFVYNIVPVGSVVLLYLFLAIYLIALLGLGLLISTYADTQQQAISIAYFVIMIFNFLSGLYTPLESIPFWAKIIAEINPLTHFIEVIRMVMLKGSAFHDIIYHLGVIIVLAVVFNTWAIFNYKKTI
jgi:ABC-2 type transport system permease protein